MAWPALGGASSGALANTYNLDIDHCTGGCSNGTLPFGTVQVTQNGANLDFLVTLNSTYVFNKSTGFDAFAFGFDNSPGAITNITAGFSAGPSPTNQDGFGTFQLGISKTATGGQSLAFTVLSETVAHLAFSTNPPGDTPVLFAADISSLVGTQTITGNVGGSTLVAGVPEPATWGMMLLGFVGLGFAFRQQRRRVSFA
jgi:PEP-CTERM motif